MPEWIVGGLSVLAISAVPSVVAYFLSRLKTEEFGFKIGKMITVFGTKKGGKSYTKSEGRLQATLNDFVKGINQGMDSDDG
jgi:hypothetical protein